MMKTISTVTLTLLISKIVLANSIILNTVYNELELYKKQYKIENLISIDYKGLINKKYVTDVTYTKEFCDIKDNPCSLFKCNTPALVDSDLVVDFESETDSNVCKKQKTQEEIKTCVDTCLASSEKPSSALKSCVAKCN